VKLVITILSTLILLVHIQPISYLSDAAVKGTLSSVDYSLRIQMVAASSAALVALLVATVLAVYKPKGMTPYG
jgi:ABC-type sulfate transport system permease component